MATAERKQKKEETTDHFFKLYRQALTKKALKCVFAKFKVKIDINKEGSTEECSRGIKTRKRKS